MQGVLALVAPIVILELVETVPLCVCCLAHVYRDEAAFLT